MTLRKRRLFPVSLSFALPLTALFLFPSCTHMHVHAHTHRERPVWNTNYGFCCIAGCFCSLADMFVACLVKRFITHAGFHSFSSPLTLLTPFWWKIDWNGGEYTAVLHHFKAKWLYLTLRMCAISNLKASHSKQQKTFCVFGSILLSIEDVSREVFTRFLPFLFLNLLFWQICYMGWAILLIPRYISIFCFPIKYRFFSKLYWKVRRYN